MPLRQLSRTEYANALTDLFGDAQGVAQLLPGDVAGTSGFATAGLASDVTIRALQQAAETLAKSADVMALTGCDAAGAGATACIDNLLDGFAKRAFRRPLTAVERADYHALYGSLQSELGLSFDAATRTLLEAIVMAPAFLYHWELGASAPSVGADGVIQLSNYEVASRLAFLLWSSIPDDELLAAAASDALSTAEGVELQARRLLASDKAVGAMRNFHVQWLDVSLGGSKSPELYPTFNPKLAAAMADELAALTTNLFQSGGTVGDLFLSRQGFVSPELARLYGSGAAVTGPLAPLTLDATRPGLLTRAGFLASTSNAYEGDPTKRGVVIRKRVLCETLVPPPANVPPLPPADPSLSVRDRHSQHMAVEPCRTCHALTDPIGFGFGTFDAVGAYHDTEAGKPIDASGTVAQLDGADRAFSDVTGLMRLLSESEDVRACLTKQWLRFALARGEQPADYGALQSTYQAFASSGFSLSELLVGLTRSRSFRYRAPAPGEALQ